MTDITREDLRKYQGLKVEIYALQEEINALYSPVGSPPTEVIGSRSTTPGDPTAQAALAIDAKKHRLEEKLHEFLDLSSRIERFVNGIDDHFVAGIIRLHFIVGYSWRKTCTKVYGYPDPDVCRKAFNRYMSKLEGEEKDTNDD